MQISRFLKSILYLVLALALTVISTMLQLAFQKSDTLAGAYFQSNLYMFVMAAACIGTSVYSFRAYTRRHREHASESVFLLVVGIVLMIASIVTVVSFGGLGEEFTEAGYTAANVNILLTTALPLPFLVRAFILAISCARHEPSRRLPALIACGIVTAVYLLSLIFGGMMRMVHYQEPPYDSPSSSVSDGVYTEDEGGKSV